MYSRSISVRASSSVAASLLGSVRLGLAPSLDIRPPELVRDQSGLSLYKGPGPQAPPAITTVLLGSCPTMEEGNLVAPVQVTFTGAASWTAITRRRLRRATKRGRCSSTHRASPRLGLGSGAAIA